MTTGNGKIVDEGLAAMQEAFKDAQFMSIEAKEASERMQLGEHRSQSIPDNVIMEVYGSITAGKNIELAFTADSGNGFVAHITSYADMIALMQGTIKAVPIGHSELKT